MTYIINMSYITYRYKPYIPWIPWHTITYHYIWFISYHDIRLHTITHHDIPLIKYHYNILQSITCHYIPAHYITIHYITKGCMVLWGFWRHGLVFVQRLPSFIMSWFWLIFPCISSICPWMLSIFDGVHRFFDCFRWNYREKNPPAPKVPRRGSLVARDMNSQLVQLQLGGPTSSRCTVSSPLGRTLNKVEPKDPKLPHVEHDTWTFMRITTWHQFGVHLIDLGTTSAQHYQLAPTWAKLGPR